MRNPRRAALAAGAAAACLAGQALAADENYAQDRALIENLQARYLFALDFGDPEA